MYTATDMTGHLDNCLQATVDVAILESVKLSELVRFVAECYKATIQRKQDELLKQMKG